MAIKVSKSFGEELCGILGLDSTKVMAITIRVEPDDIVLVDVTSSLTVDEAEKFKDLLIKNRVQT